MSLTPQILDVHELADDQRADDCSTDRDDDHLEAERIARSASACDSLEIMNSSRQRRRKPRSTQPVMRPCADRTRTWRFTRKRSRITEREITEDLREVAACFTLRQHGGDEELRVEHRNALAEVA